MNGWLHVIHLCQFILVHETNTEANLTLALHLTLFCIVRDINSNNMWLGVVTVTLSCSNILAKFLPQRAFYTKAIPETFMGPFSFPVKSHKQLSQNFNTTWTIKKREGL